MRPYRGSKRAAAVSTLNVPMVAICSCKIAVDLPLLLNNLLSIHQGEELHLFRQLQHEIELKTLALTMQISDLQAETDRLACRKDDNLSAGDEDVERQVASSLEASTHDGADPMSSRADMASLRCVNILISSASLYIGPEKMHLEK